MIEREPCITYVETRSVGHYPVWVRAVAEAFVRMQPAGRMHVWLPDDFREKHGAWAEQYFVAKAEAGVRFDRYDLLGPAAAKTGDAGSIASEMETILRCTESDRGRVCYIGYLDGQLRNIARGRFDAMRGRLVGVLDQPYLHYWRIGGCSGSVWRAGAMLLKGLAVNVAAVHRRVVGRVLMGDPLAPPFYRLVVCSGKFRFLPEPFSATCASPFPRRRLKLPEDRLLLLFIGGTERRKGICELLCALESVLREHAELRARIAFVLAGRVIAETRDAVYGTISRMKCALPDVPISVHDGLLTDQEYVDYLAAADLVCIPYIKMIGTSGVLAHAANAGHPVLSSNFGITGELVRRYRLGVTCTTNDARSLQNGLLEAIEMAQTREAAPNAQRERFLSECAMPSDQLGETIVRHLLEVAGATR